MTEFDAIFKQLSNAAEKVHISPSYLLRLEKGAKFPASVRRAELQAEPPGAGHLRHGSGYSQG